MLRWGCRRATSSGATAHPCADPVRTCYRYLPAGSCMGSGMRISIAALHAARHALATLVADAAALDQDLITHGRAHLPHLHQRRHHRAPAAPGGPGAKVRATEAGIPSMLAMGAGRGRPPNGSADAAANTAGS